MSIITKMLNRGDIEFMGENGIKVAEVKVFKDLTKKATDKIINR